MIPVFLSCPVRPIEGETKESNLARARFYYKVLSLALPDYTFIAPWILNCEVFPETPEAIELGMKRNKFWIDRCIEVWCCGPRVSSGMGDECAWIRRPMTALDNDGRVTLRVGSRPGIVRRVEVEEGLLVATNVDSPYDDVVVIGPAGLLDV